jgi:DNA-binding response OmpR family regulator
MSAPPRLARLIYGLIGIAVAHEMYLIALAKLPAFIRRGSLLVDLARHRVTLDEVPLPLSPLEFKLLAYLASQAPRVIAPQELVRQVHGFEATPLEARDLVRYHVYHIRQKAARSGRPDLIRTVHGVGYTLGE